MDWNYVSGLANFMFEDMFMNGVWRAIFNGIGISCMFFGLIYAIYGLFFRKVDEE
jgi:hypothetical protein